MEKAIQDPVAGTLLLAVLGLVLKSGVDIIKELMQSKKRAGYEMSSSTTAALHADFQARLLALEKQFASRTDDYHDLRDTANAHFLRIAERLARIEVKMGMPPQ